MDLAAALRDLDARQPESMPGPTLERISALARLLGDPQLTYPSIHVTGTNGKTTTTRLVSALACAHGLTAGAFVSPHLESVLERLTVCGDPIPDEEFADEYARLLPYLEQVDAPGSRVTYFEALTALAYLWFSDKPVGVGVFEVGMGGTWDATNLIRGDVAVLCPVGLDHPQLGSTVEEVATEKAGIIKEGQVALAREQRPEAMRVIERRAAEMGAELLVEGRAFGVQARSVGLGGQVVSMQTLHGGYEDVFVPLFGQHAARNAVTAIAATEALLGRALEEAGVRAALERATSPGRIEVVDRRPLVVLDGAHNPDAMQALTEALAESFHWDELRLVIGMFADKDVEGVIRLVAPMADRAYACMSSSPRAAPVERVAAALEDGGVHAVRFDTVAQAVATAMSQAAEGDLILVTGSFYTVADARPLFR